MARAFGAVGSPAVEAPTCPHREASVAQPPSRTAQPVKSQRHDSRTNDAGASAPFDHVSTAHMITQALLVSRRAGRCVVSSARLRNRLLRRRVASACGRRSAQGRPRSDPAQICPGEKKTRHESRCRRSEAFTRSCRAGRRRFKFDDFERHGGVSGMRKAAIYDRASR